MKEDRVSALIADFQQRLPAFVRHHRRIPREVKEDFITRWMAEHILLGSKIGFDGWLQGMLTDEEHARLDLDREFTQAWRIFVDLCWIRKQFQRALWVLLALALLIGLILGALLLLPILVGPD